LIALIAFFTVGCAPPRCGGDPCCGDPCCGDPCCGDPCCGDPCCGSDCATERRPVTSSDGGTLRAENADGGVSATQARP
jgi:hypothetical protein